MHIQAPECSVFGAEERRVARSPASYALGLPNELWCIIWENLALSGRLCVSQVCSRWRSTALASPCLWATLEFVFSPVHPPGCLCLGCRHPPHTAGKPPRSAAPDNVGAVPIAALSLTSVALLRALLGRSGHLELSLTLDIISAQAVDLRALGGALQPHLPRLRALHILSAHVDVPGQLLASLDRPLPVLRVLTAGPGHHPAPGAFDAKEYLALAPHLALPALEEVHLAGGLSWPREPGPVALPTVHTLAFAPLRASSILAALATCPSLRALDVDVRGLEAWDCGPELREALARVPAVRVSGIWSGIEEYVLRAIGYEGLRRAELDYRGAGAGCPLARPSAHPFRGLTSPLRLSLSLRDDARAVCIYASDAAGRSREVRFDKAKLVTAPGMWYYLSLPVAAATVDAALWSYFASNAPAVRAIPELAVVLSEPAELLTVGLTAFQRGALRKLRIALDVPGQRLSAAAIASLLRSLGSERRLQTLSLVGAGEIDDVKPLYRLVDTIEC